MRKRNTSAINSVKTQDKVVKGSQSIAHAYDTDAHETQKHGQRDSLVKQSDFASPRLLNSCDSNSRPVNNFRASPLKRRLATNKLADSDIKIVAVASKQ